MSGIFEDTGVNTADLRTRHPRAGTSEMTFLVLMQFIESGVCHPLLDNHSYGIQMCLSYNNHLLQCSVLISVSINVVVLL